MYVTTADFIVLFSLVLVCGSLSMFLVLFFTLRHYVTLKASESSDNKELLENTLLLIEQEQANNRRLKEELLIKTEAIQRAVYEAHHKKRVPIFKTLRGLLNLIRLSHTDVRSREYINLMEAQILQAERDELEFTKHIEHLQD